MQIEDLSEIPYILDRREEILSEQYGYERNHWAQKRFPQIREGLLKVDDKDLLERQATLVLDGFTHIAGMVGSGKSTLATLLAAYIIHRHPGKRLTLVVGDVQTAIKLANQFNWWFRNCPTQDQPAAVPLLGRSGREGHMQGFYSSEDYQDHVRRGQPHWGERWLSPVCPLQDQITEDDFENKLLGNCIKPGREPCQRLFEIAEEDEELDKKGKSKKVAKKKMRACPFLPICPQYQLHRDMPHAQIWITTPGGMGAGSLPSQLEERPFKIGELVYEQSDIVIFDEADTVIKWYDDMYATEINLTGGGNGILDDITLDTEQYSVRNRVMPFATQRWVGAERNAQQITSAVLTLLNNRRGKEYLRTWISRHYVTPLTLFYKLARRIAGLEEYEFGEITEELRQQQEETINEVMQHFDELLNHRDPVRIPPALLSDTASNRLIQIIQSINNTGESAMDTIIYEQCYGWIERFFPDTPQKLEALRQELSTRESKVPRRKKKSNNANQTNDSVDTLETLAYRLQFALTVALLDRHSRIIFYEWDNRPPQIRDTSPSYRSNTTMREILPLPLTGRQFGTYYSRSGNSNDRRRMEDENTLSLFAYTNIGRYYALGFHELLTDFDGERGPNVLAMSGTSYLPASTSFHVGKPALILSSSEEAKKAIAQSVFHFIPQRDRHGEPIRISGRAQDQKRGLFQQITHSLVGYLGSGHFNKTLTEIRQLGEEKPLEWYDRERLLVFVNSYKQAQWAAETIRKYWPAMQDYTKHLIPDKEEVLQEELKLTVSEAHYAIRRADIEQFVHTGGKILVAPMSAIGRGFNILNTRGKAAFGAVYFLTRPYPHPHNTQAIAQEMNRRAWDWKHEENFSAWLRDGLWQKGEEARRQAARYWRLVENRSYYHTLYDVPELMAFPRSDLAATTIGYIIQAVGRLVRGGVPFYAYFVDAAWGPLYAKDQHTPDTPSTSLLAAMIELLTNYVADDKICAELYGPLAEALDRIENFQWQPDEKN